MSRELNEKPLSGIRVIDFGQYIAGPLAGMLLADQGAEVIRIDPPGGPLWSSPANSFFNRGKLSVVLDLKEDEGKQYAIDLIRRADVVIENFRPGVMDRLGLGRDLMTELNSKLVYLSLPGFASSDVEKSGIQAWEGVIAAATGIYTDISLTQKFLKKPPMYTALPMCSTYGAIHGATAVMMALVGREKDGHGEIIEVPLADAVMSAMGVILQDIEKLPPRYSGPDPISNSEIFKQLNSADGDEEKLELLKSLSSPIGELGYHCQDGRRLLIVGNAHQSHCKRLLQVCGLLDGLIADGIKAENPYVNGDDEDNLFLCASKLSAKWRLRIRKGLSEVFATKPANEWEKILGEAGVPCTVQYSTEEWIGSDAAKKSGLVTEIEDPNYGPMLQMNRQFWSNSISNNVPLKPAGPLGSSFEEVRTIVNNNTPYPPRDRSIEMRSQYLEDISVIDLCNVIGGPICGRVLAEYGANVIKFDSPNPLHYPECTCFYALDVGRGKKSILVDLEKDKGKEILDKLVSEADVLINNTTKTNAMKWGLDQGSLEQVNSKIISGTLSAFGGINEWGRSSHVGYDETAQAMTGIMMRYGSKKEPSEHADASCVDYVTGMSLAFGLGVALYHRMKTGQAISVETSLAAGGQFAQAPFFYTYEGRGSWDEPSGQNSIGENKYYRLYKSADDWLFIGAKDLDVLLKVPEFRELGRSSPGLQLELEEKVKSRPAAYWESLLKSNDIGVHKVVDLKSIRKESITFLKPGEYIDFNNKSILVTRNEYNGLGSVDLVVPSWVRLKSVDQRLFNNAPVFGQDTKKILHYLNYSNGEIEEMLISNVVACSWPHGHDYLPK